jgi:serine/threonine protein kinase
VYEFIEGETLEERLQRGRLEHREAARLVADVADALHYTHLHGLIHRDIKPANILLDARGRPHVTDFGLAVWYEELTKERRRPAGTPSYMSPEQVRGDADRTDSRTDIYSLGVVLYELLCGRRPFTGDTHDALFEQIAHREARPPRTIDGSVPRDLERICLKALCKQIGDRYTTGRDMAEELRDWDAADRAAAVGGDRKNMARGAGGTPTFSLRLVGTPYVYRPAGDAATVTIGRKRRKPTEPPDRGSDFVVRLTQSDRQTLQISRRHCQIHISGGDWTIVDHSKGGTLLNGERLVKGRPARIRPGDRISVAGVVEIEVLESSDYMAKPVGGEVSVPTPGGAGGHLVLAASIGDLTTVETDD